ncbi:vesicle-associated membrane protein 5-like [Salminus brasiliensis]|uniref:vesicle-associated membrane protein 5-like n=1 Tax=Salminus brasiliensis TaxID=930266 RepID=UPI003B82FA91
MDSKLAAAQREAEEVKDIMLENLNKADERKDKLGDLELRSAKLLDKAQSFHKTSKKVKQKKRKDYLKSKAGLIAVVTVLALVIIIVVVVMLVSSSSDPSVHSAAVTSKPPGQP